MTPREIDALVAIHIFGWTRYDDPNGDFLPHQGWKSPKASFGVLPEFSTDPAASKTLRDKMRADGWEYDISTGPDKKVSAEFFRAYGDGDGRSYADTEEMAVALAALAACGIEVKP